MVEIKLNDDTVKWSQNEAITRMRMCLQLVALYKLKGLQKWLSLVLLDFIFDMFTTGDVNMKNI